MLSFNLMYVLYINMFIYFLGVIGLVLNRKNILITIMAIEILLLSININFVMFSIYLDDITGQVCVLFILTVAAAESGIGLSILVASYKLKHKITMEKINIYKK